MEQLQIQYHQSSICRLIKMESKAMLVISATKRHKKDLEILAEKLGYLHGERPNISGMIRAIASGELQVSVSKPTEN